MPRKRTLRVMPYGNYKTERWCKVAIISVEILRNAHRLRVTFENIDSDQLGRQHCEELPVPVRPFGRTASFFGAAGVVVSIDRRISIDDVVGKTILVRFEKAPDGQWRIAAFKPEAESIPQSPVAKQPESQSLSILLNRKDSHGR